MVATLIGIALLLEMVAGSCTSDKYGLNGDSCCDRCAPGFGVLTECSGANNTVCEQCSEGTTFSSHSSRSEACQMCSECSKYETVKCPCNITHDTECECMKDFYFSKDDEFCKLCKLCPAGWGALTPCSKQQDTVCHKCPNGTFSDVISAAKSCEVCRICAHNQLMIQLCTDAQDTLCVDIPQLFIPGTTVEPFTVAEYADTQKRVDIIPLYCAILGAVVVGLLGYVVIKNYRRFKDKQLGREPHEDVEYSRASGGDSGVFVENETVTKTYTMATQIRELPQNKRKEFECYLIGPTMDLTSWKHLARELGFSNKRITSLKVKAQHDPFAPVHHLLDDWGRSSTATVENLVKALQNIGRQDLVELLQNDAANTSATNKGCNISNPVT